MASPTCTTAELAEVLVWATFPSSLSPAAPTMTSTAVCGNGVTEHAIVMTRSLVPEEVTFPWL